ncbi:hypothetical protein BT93_I1177 [Corymbia citriodora subsp. variegata]|nr:hypothetical protein BT93_I1177 [Corymbia citriodora subsp. variegata]
MCIAVFLWQAHPLYPLFLLRNRDEYPSRPTEPVAWWDNGEILGGRDGLAGGTWLACSRSGKIAFVTNVAEVGKVPEPKSRGDLPVRFLEAVRLRTNFEKFLEKHGSGELPAEEMADKLMTDATKADKTMLPGIYSVEFEHSLSSIFVEANTDQGRYGTRSISAVSVKTSGEVAFYEKYLEEESWIEHTASYVMEQTGTG